MAFTPTYAILNRMAADTLGYIEVGDLTMDSTNAYPSGGFAISGSGAQIVGILTILGLKWLGGNTAALGYVPYWNTQTSKLQILQSAGSAAPLAEFSGTFGAGITIRIGTVGY